MAELAMAVHVHQNIRTTNILFSYLRFSRCAHTRRADLVAAISCRIDFTIGAVADDVVLVLVLVLASSGSVLQTSSHL